jgi:hypothetical protein
VCVCVFAGKLGLAIGRGGGPKSRNKRLTN